MNEGRERLKASIFAIRHLRLLAIINKRNKRFNDSLRESLREMLYRHFIVISVLCARQYAI